MLHLAVLLSQSSRPRYADSLLEGRLLCKPGIPKVSQAGDEATRVKKLMGALRYLYRNSSFGFDIMVVSIFNFLKLGFQKLGVTCVHGVIFLCPQNTHKGENSFHPRVSELKQMLKPSPRSDVPLQLFR